MTPRLITSLVLPVVVGILLSWACVSLVGVLAVVVSEQSFFGFPVHLVIEAESFLAWAPLSFLTGLAVGSLMREKALVVAFATAAMAFLVLLFSAPESLWVGSSSAQAIEAVSFYFSAGAFWLLAVPLGAAIARYLDWPKRSFQRHASGRR